uniref:GTP binding protein overexpressed in skeletal muscle n=1 Tax=Hypotaenidia okinawae TaxID=2861861 RepID=A0A6G1RYR0_9GRUI
MESKTTRNEQRAGSVLMEMRKELNVSQRKIWLDNLNCEQIIHIQLLVFFVMHMTPQNNVLLIFLLFFPEDTYERTLMVDGESATIILLDMWDNKREGEWIRDHCMQVGDAYLIVYSITDRASFEKASELRIQLRRARQKEDIPIILVGNKSDLVRCREVSVAEGRACAVVFDCKFIETSAAVQHNVKELFEGIVRQVRLRRDSKEKNEKRLAYQKRRESIPKKARRFWGKIVAKNNKNMAFKLKSKSCHDLSVL